MVSAAALVLVEQLVEALGLAGVVAEDDRGHPVAHEPAEAADVALDGLGRARREAEVGGLLARLVGRHLDVRAERAERPLGA
jgi:hypothetical protein